MKIFTAIRCFVLQCYQSAIKSYKFFIDTLLEKGITAIPNKGIIRRYKLQPRNRRMVCIAVNPPPWHKHGEFTVSAAMVRK